MIWVCEYSPVQDAFHVDTLERVLAVNRETAARGKSPGFVPLFLGLSSEEAHAFADRWRLEHCVRALFCEKKEPPKRPSAVNGLDIHILP